MIDDQRHGIAVATLANVNRNSKKKPDPYRPTDFIYWHPVHRDTGPTLLKDAEAQSKLIKQMFHKLQK